MKMMKEDRGLTLVELVITIAIVSIVIAAATSFMITGSRSFAKGSADSDLQKEAELTVNQIEDMIIDVNGGLEVNEVTDVDGNKTKTELVMYHATEEPDESGTMETKYVKETVVWDKNAGNDQMLYSKWNVDYDTTIHDYVDGTNVANNQLLAENVSLFEVDVDTVDETAYDGTIYQIVRSVQIRVGYENSTGRVDYATSPVITLRNRMLLSGNPAEIFDEPPTVPANMTLWYYDYGIKHAAPEPIRDRESEVERGYAYDIYAYLDGGTNVNHLVDWEIEETNRTSIIGSDGVLTVLPNEPNEYLTITARYKTNPNKYARGVVKVVGGSGKSFKAITITRESLVPFSPGFGSIPTLQGDWSADEIAAIQYTWSVSAPERLENYDSIDKNKKTFAFNVKKETSNYGKVFEITLTAFAPATGETRSDKIQYRIDNATDGGDSFMKRGMMEHGEIQFWFDTDEFDYDVVALSWEYYFCDIYGNRISEYDDLLGHVWLGGNISDNYGNHHFNYTLAYDEGLPLNHEYYVKVVTHMKDPRTGTEWDHDRIFYIPAVQLFDCHYYGINDSGWFWCYFDMVGYWNVALQNYETVKNVVGVKDAEVVFEVQEQDGNWGENVVSVTAEFFDPVARTDVGPNAMRLEGVVRSNSQWWQKVIVKSITFKVYMKQYPDVYTDVTLYF